VDLFFCERERIRLAGFGFEFLDLVAVNDSAGQAGFGADHGLVK
jgi:hypothetical protein